MVTTSGVARVPSLTGSSQPVGAGAPLVYVRMDGAFQRMRRRGRFSISRAEAASFEHLQKAVKEMQEKMISGLRTAGYRYVPSGQWEFRGPFDHIPFSDSASTDQGPTERKRIDQFLNDPTAWIKWERAEKARAARRLGAIVEMVDYELVATFEKKVRGPMGVLRTQKR
jgi:hypothetical protein